MQSNRSRLVLPIGVNLFAVAIFLALGSRHSMNEEAAQDASLSQVLAGMAWELEATVIALIAIVANIVAAWLGYGKRSNSRRRTAVITAGALVVLWLAAWWFDAAHNGVRIR